MACQRQRASPNVETMEGKVLLAVFAPSAAGLYPAMAQMTSSPTRSRRITLDGTIQGVFLPVGQDVATPGGELLLDLAGNGRLAPLGRVRAHGSIYPRAIEFDRQIN